MIRIKVYIPFVDIQDNCEHKSDFYGDIEINVNDITFITAKDLIELIKSNPEYLPIIKKELEEWNIEGESS